MSNSTIFISVIVPIYNEQESLPALFTRLMTVMKSINLPFELIYINDGSTDQSEKMLRGHQKDYPSHVRVLDFDQNYGQHIAILAGFEAMKGDIALNLDADLQNPPEEIPKLIEKVLEGHDMVGSYRLKRKDHKWRGYGSRFANFVRGWITPLKMKDQGCMFRAYSKEIVKKICAGKDHCLFIPALGWRYAKNPIEIGLAHEERTQGTSKYNLYHLLRVSLDLMTSTTLLPLQLITFTGIVSSVISLFVFIFLMGCLLINGSEKLSLFIFLSITTFLLSLAITAIGIVGEYVGRTYQIVAGRPRYSFKEAQNYDDITDNKTGAL